MHANIGAQGPVNAFPCTTILIKILQLSPARVVATITTTSTGDGVQVNNQCENHLISQSC